jgi:hypothetical protein
VASSASPNPKPAETPKETQPVTDQDVLVATRASASVGGSPIRNDLFDPNIVAKPLTSSTDPFFNLRPKNPEVMFRGITHTVITKDGPSFVRFEQAKAQGYQVATAADVVGAVPASLLREGKIINGDLILMKISSAAYRGALKWKDQQAIRATQKVGVADQAKNEIQRAAQETNMPQRLSRKLNPFAPSGSEITKDFGDE